MTGKYSSLFVYFMVALSMCQANPLSWSDYDLESEDSEGRLITSNGGFSLTNSTIDGNAILAIILIGILLALAYGGSFGLGGNNYYKRHGYDPYHHQQGAYENTNFYARSNKHVLDEELATQLYLLENAFKYWDVDNDACKTFVVCEASKKELEQNEAEVVKKTRTIMGDMSKHKAVLYKEPFRRLLSIFLKEEKDLEAKCSKAKQACFASKKSY